MRKVFLTFLVCRILFSQETSALEISRVHELINRKFPNYCPLTIGMLSIDAKKEYFTNHNSSDPGILLQDFQKQKKIDAAIILVDKKSNNGNCQLVIIIYDINKINPKIEILEDFRKYKNGLPNSYLIFQKSVDLKSFDNKNIHMSSDGFIRIKAESSARLFFWKNGIVNSAWLTD